MSGLTILGGFQRAQLRSYLEATLPATCMVQRVAANGQPETVATAPCRVTYPRTRDGIVYLDDQRTATIHVPPETDIPGNADLVVVMGGPTYRIVHVPGKRADDLLRVIECTEARPGQGAA